MMASLITMLPEDVWVDSFCFNFLLFVNAYMASALGLALIKSMLSSILSNCQQKNNLFPLNICLKETYNSLYCCINNLKKFIINHIYYSCRHCRTTYFNLVGHRKFYYGPKEIVFSKFQIQNLENTIAFI